MASNLSNNKKPSRGILKPSSSFDKPMLHSNQKNATFDDMNVLQTFHPVGKDYGHMKIDEPKTPYRIQPEDNNEFELNAESLAEKLRHVATGSSINEFGIYSIQEKLKRKEFEERRKKHYNEFEAVRHARSVILQDENNEEKDSCLDSHMDVDKDTISHPDV